LLRITAVLVLGILSCALTGAAAQTGFLSGSPVNSDGTLASNPRNPYHTSEAQSRSEFTVQDLDYRVQQGFIVLLESSTDLNIPLTGPPRTTG
jgi:hypothetical protein